MRAANRYHGMINLHTCGLLSLFDGALDRSDRLVEINDHTLATAASLPNAVSAITQTSLTGLSHEGERFGAADIQRDDQVLLLLAHFFFPFPFGAGFGFFGASLMVCGLGASADCECESGLTITWPSKRRSTDSNFVNC